MKILKELIESQLYEEALNLLIREARNETDFTKYSNLCRYRKRIADRISRSNDEKVIKIAILGGATTEFIEEPLTLALEVIGLKCKIHRSEYNAIVQEIIDDASSTIKFNPDVVIVMNTPVNILSWPKPYDSIESVNSLVDEVCQYWLNLCGKLYAKAQCEIILNNFHYFQSGPFGNLSAKLPWDKNNFIQRINLKLGDSAPSYLHINDVNTLSAYYGLTHWFDLRYWFHAKQPVSFECAIRYVRNTASIIGALYGRTSKCLVLDLDNTLWGGVIGDDGLDGILIGEGNATGEAFKMFQEYIKKLKQRGTLLAVCSKNDEKNALSPFLKHPDMVLKRDDFVSFKANWDPKPDNISRIAEELNICIDSLVFVDDNPAECEHVRQRLPSVKVIELTDDPADYPRLIDESGFFEQVSISTEDQDRTLQYQENKKRIQLSESSSDYADYLRTLDQKAVIRPFEEIFIERITQLINKSNQSNLTTLRLNRSQVEALMHDDNTITAYVRLVDKFGDNGLIAVFSAHRDNNDIWIDEWLMSCRVLMRGVEQLLCNYVVEKAREMNISKLYGIYRPSSKNELVRKHYESLGFNFLKEDNNNATYWSLLVECYKPFDIQIKLVDEY